MSAINEFLLRHKLRIATNPCVSPDFCLDWDSLRGRLTGQAGAVTLHPTSRFATAVGSWTLAEDSDGDHAWILESQRSSAEALAVLEQGVALGSGRGYAFPASWSNLLKLKNLIQAHDPRSTIFPTASGTLEHASLGVGARFTTLHWPAVEWAMAHLGLSMTANQNSIPRELVYDVGAMLEGSLDTVAFPFIGGNVPEGHQGQSVEGMSHGAVLSKLKTGFHRRGISWGFNADHQPVGGKFDAREDRLVEGCLLATYITFDLSPELGATPKREDPARWCAANVPADLLRRVRDRVAKSGIVLDESPFHDLVASVWPAVQKMKERDRKYARARERAFSAPIGRAYFRELSIDELPGLTTPATLATMLALCEALDMRVQFVAPAFGFQKNFPFADNVELERRVSAAWKVCKDFDVSIGFHSGSGKSADNYRLCGRITGQRLEIKTSGRYTYEMGRALASSVDGNDRALWVEWYRFTRDMALASAFGADETERTMARQFIVHALELEGMPREVFASQETCAAALAVLSPNPDHMFWFEYNFLFVLAAGGRPDKASLGDHTAAGYRQRARFYAISDQGRLAYAKAVIEYLCFLAQTTGVAAGDVCAAAQARLGRLTSYRQLLDDIAPADSR